MWLVQRFKPRWFENVRFFLIWPNSAETPVLDNSDLRQDAYLLVPKIAIN